MTFSPIQPLGLREQVVEQVRVAIIEGRLKPNDHIAEVALTQQMGVSRTPVREALILLEREGLVVSYPNRGYFVRAFTAQDVDDIFSMRTALENFAGELNIQRFTEDDHHWLETQVERQRAAIEQNNFKHVRTIDMNFHRYLIDRTAHALLIRNWTELVAQIAALLYVRAEGLVYDEYKALEDHHQIVAAYRARDLDALTACNHKINARVAVECQTALSNLERRQAIR